MRTVLLFSFFILSLLFSVPSLAATGDDIEITADQLKMDLTSQSLKLTDNVEVQYLDVTIKSPTAFYQYDKKELWMGSAVRATFKDLSFSSQELRVYQRQGELVGSGTVKVLFDPYTGYAEKVRYLKEKNVIILTGNPRFVNQDETLHAETLILNTETRQIESRGKTRFSSSKKTKET